HIVFGIAWIGASFYFIFLENSLNRTKGLRDELAGNLWAIHGGVFYYLEKYKVAPGELPEKLHWFKYEAYFTWLTGFMLLILVYYLNAGSYMVDPSVATISTSTAIITGIGSLVAGWLIYDFMCKSSLLRHKKAFALIGFIIITGFSWYLSTVLSGRAAFMHVGAILGTCMVGNVFYVIIPAQKALVRAARAGRAPDPALGAYAGLRSLHNNYMTFPVLFIMISNHFPITFSSAWNWIILTGLSLASVAVRHYINQHEKGRNLPYLLVLAFIGIIALVIATAPKSTENPDRKISFTEVQPIFRKHCVSCHSSHPTDEVQKIAPNGVMLETADQIKRMTDKILVRAVQTHSMPQGNKTGMTEEERILIGQWIKQGAPIN
ncbi:MAG: urate hydroxylase PuuD, partial [Bacteroidota bacterium]